jgi:hypothetical protein
MSNKDVAQSLAQLADAIAQYDHLPTLGRVVWSHNGTVDVEIESDRYALEGIP